MQYKETEEIQTEKEKETDKNRTKRNEIGD